jgi:hypothetical protein
MASPHPRTFGTFPRVLAKYVRERKLLTLVFADSVAPRTVSPVPGFTSLFANSVASVLPVTLIALAALVITRHSATTIPIRYI